LLSTPTTSQSLASLLKSARDIMRKDKGLNGDLDRLPLLTWIMFLKFLDDLERQRESEALLTAKPFKPAVEAPYRWRDWADKADGITGDELLSFINAEECARPDGTKGPSLRQPSCLLERHARQCFTQGSKQFDHGRKLRVGRAALKAGDNRLFDAADFFQLLLRVTETLPCLDDFSHQGDLDIAGGDFLWSKNFTADIIPICALWRYSVIFHGCRSVHPSIWQ
jgi:hypothetical protein